MSTSLEKCLDMKIIVQFLLILLLASGPMLAQDDLIPLPIPDLEELLAAQVADNARKIDILNELAYKYKNSNLDKGQQRAEQALKLALVNDYRTGIATAYVRLGLLHWKQGDAHLAELNYLRAIEIRQQLGVAKDIAGVYLNLGLLFKTRNFEKSINYYRQGLGLLKGEPYPDRIAKFHNNMATLFRQYGQYDSALVHLNLALDIRKELDNRTQLAMTYLNIGNLYFDLENLSAATANYKRAEEHFEESQDTLGMAQSLNGLGNVAFKHGEWAVAKGYFQQIQNFEHTLSVEEQIIRTKNLASAELALNNRKVALPLFERSLAQAKKAGIPFQAATISYDIGLLYFFDENYPLSIQYHKETYEAAKEQHYTELRAKALYYLSQAHSQAGDSNIALEYSNQYIQLQDSLDENTRKALNLQINLERNKNEISNLKVHHLEKTQETMITYGILAFVLLFVVVGTIVYYQEQRKQMAFLQIDELLIEKERSTNYARLEEQEKERNRIAQDLHDRLGSMLSVVKLSLGSIDSKIENLQEESRAQYAKANKLLDEACEEVRNIAHNLKNSTLAKFGLKPALETFVESLQGGQLEIELNLYNLDNRLDNKIEMNVFHIIQELVSNTLKHAKASKLVIQVNRFEELLNVTVEDDGNRFSTGAKQSKILRNRFGQHRSTRTRSGRQTQHRLRQRKRLHHNDRYSSLREARR